MLGGMKSRCWLPSGLAFGLVLASASVARADDSRTDAALLAPPEAIPTHVLVHIESPKPVQLESRGAGHPAWAAVCGVPCDKELPLADEYRFAPGPTFHLRSTAGDSVVLKVRPASLAATVGGGALVGVGAFLAVVGAVGLTVGLAAAAQPTPTCGDHSSYLCGAGPGIGKASALVSVLPLLGGAGMIAGGASVLADSKTSITQRPFSGREPTWVGPQSAAPKKAGLFVPLSFAFY